MNNNDSLGDRMKLYEGNYSGGWLMPLVPAVIRLDGRAFHSYTRRADKPFDMTFIEKMTVLTMALVKETNACVGYTQSDEINLVLNQTDYKSEMYFGGRIGKINSILAATCSTLFNQDLPWQACHNPPVFDCRCFSVPSKQEGVNALIWREQDATRNSIQMAGQAQFSPNQLLGRSCEEIQEMLFTQKGINWNDYPRACKRGTYVQRQHVVRPFTVDEIEKLPLKHEARTNPDLIVERAQIQVLEDMPVATKIKNLIDVVYDGAKPEVETV